MSDPPTSPAPPSVPPPPGEQVDTGSCSLLGPVGLAVQGLMGILVIASLLVKRQREGGPKRGKRRRKWKVWALDVSKQLIGQAAVHASNLLISDQVAAHGGENACSLYFLNVLVDTTLGVLVLYTSLKLLTRLSQHIWGDKGFASGVYDDPPRLDYFARQLGVYMASLLIMKLFVLLLFWLTLDAVLLPVADSFLDWMRKWFQVVFVEAIFPLFMNILQFWIIDSVIKASSEAQSGSTDLESADYQNPSPVSLAQNPGSDDNIAPGSPRRRRKHSSISENMNGETNPFVISAASPLLGTDGIKDGYGSQSEHGSPTALTPNDRGYSKKVPPKFDLDGAEVDEVEEIMAETDRILGGTPRGQHNLRGGTESLSDGRRGRDESSIEDHPMSSKQN